MSTATATKVILRPPAPRVEHDKPICVHCHAPIVIARAELTIGGFSCDVCAREYPVDVDGDA